MENLYTLITNYSFDTDGMPVTPGHDTRYAVWTVMDHKTITEGALNTIATMAAPHGLEVFVLADCGDTLHWGIG